MKDPPGIGQVDAPPSQRTLDDYVQAFPDADAGALAAHLDVTTTSAFLTRGIEAEIQEVGFDLTRPRYTIVRSLYLNPENAIAQSDLAQRLRVSGPNITQLIDGLVAEGWVERVASPSDRRVVHARLTSQGRKMAARLIPAIVDFMEDSCSTLTEPERAELARLLNKVRDAVGRRVRP